MKCLGLGFCKFMILLFFMLHMRSTAGHTRLLVDSADVYEFRMHQMELTIQNMKAHIAGYDNLINQIKSEMRDKNSQIGNLTTIVTYLQRRVAFMAEATGGGSHIRPTIGQHIVFDKVHLNEGNGYHSNHGTFIAPTSGLYVFSFGCTVRIGSGIYTHIHMKQNGMFIGYIFFDNRATGSWQKESESIVAYLHIGEEVWIKITDAIGSVEVATETMHTFFSGYLIKGDS